MPLSADALKLQIRLMRQEAERGRSAARCLAEVIGDHGDSTYLLDLLAFELLLKAAVRIHAGEREDGHEYRALFFKLPAVTRAGLIEVAAARMGPEAPYDELRKILGVWQSNFISLRYPFEKYEGMTAAEYEKIGTEWPESGAPESTAIFRYFPEQLFGLLFALEQDVDSWLATA